MKSKWTIDINSLAVLCIVIAGIVQALQQALSSAPSVTSTYPWLVISGKWNYAPIVLIAIAAVSWIARQFIGENGSSQTTLYVDRASLDLHFFGDTRSPTRVTAANVWRWYFLHTILVEVNASAGQQSLKSVGGSLFVTFDPFVHIGTLTISSPDMQLPLYELKEFNSRYAVITFSGQILAGTVEIRVAP